MSPGVSFVEGPLPQRIRRSSRDDAGQQHLLELLDGLLLLPRRGATRLARPGKRHHALSEHTGRPVVEQQESLEQLHRSETRHGRTADLLPPHRRRKQGGGYHRISCRLPNRLRAGHQCLDQPPDRFRRQQEIPCRDLGRPECQ